MDFDKYLELKGGALGAGVGGLVGWTFGSGDGFVDWAGWLLITYPFGIGFLVIANKHQRGFIWGLGVAGLRIIGFFGAVAAWLAILLILASPFALMLSSSVGKTVLEWFPTGSQLAAVAGMTALGIVALTAVCKTRAGGALIGGVFGGLNQGMCFGIGLLVLGFVMIPVWLAVSMIMWICDGWPGGWVGPLFGIILGAGSGLAHGYISTFAASALVDIEP